MKTKFYITVETDKELPENPEATIMAKEYMTDNGWLLFEGNNDPQINWYDNNLDKYYVCKWWLKEIDLPDMLIEFEAWKLINIHDNFLLDSFEIVNKFLQSKGISI